MLKYVIDLAMPFSSNTSKRASKKFIKHRGGVFIVQENVRSLLEI